MVRDLSWTLLSDSLYAEMEKLAECRRLAPDGAARNRWSDLFELAREARRCDALFGMNVEVRPRLPLAALSLAAGGGVVRAMFYADPWKNILHRIRAIDRLLRHDIVYIPYTEPFEELRRGPGGERYRYLPFAADTRVFYDRGHARDIDILSMGRRDESLHRAILAYANERNLVYRYRENTGFIADPMDLGRLAARARYFVVSPPPMERSGGYSPLVMRYFEGLAAGCRLVGTRPTSGEFEALLPLRSLLEVAADGSDFAERFEQDQSDGEAWKLTAEATRLVHQHHSWDARARTILAEIGLILDLRR